MKKEENQMKNEFGDVENEQFLIDVLVKIVGNSEGCIRPQSNRIDDLDKYLFTLSLMSDEYSHNLYAKILSRMLAFEFLDNKTAASLFPIWSEEFAREYNLKRQTVTLPDLKHPNDRGSQHIFPETFCMPAYNYHDICCVEEGDVVFDVGAWIGDTAYVFSKKACGGG